MTRRFALVVMAVGAGCSSMDATLGSPDPDFNRMIDQPRSGAYARSVFFPDRAAMRHPPEGTVPFRGSDAAPPSRRYPPTAGALEAGRKRFRVVCAPCHGVDGYAETPVAERMALRPPPSLHSHKARTLTDAEIRDIVREGYGLMPSYEDMLDRRARWNVVHHVRALQLSQYVRAETLPREMRDELDEVSP